MEKLLIIPKADRITEYESYAKKMHLGYEYNDFFMPNLLDDPKLLESRIAFYQKHSIGYSTLHGVFFDVIVASYDAKIAKIAEERIYSSMDIARRLGAKKVVFHTNLDPSLPQDFYLENWLCKNISFYQKLSEKYQDIDIVIENMFDKNPYMLLKLIDGINRENVHVCLDIAHANLSDCKIEEWISTLRPYISHIHINDNMGKIDSHLAIGNGNMDYKSLIPFLNDFKGTILIEVSTLEAFEESIENLIKLGLKY